MSLELLPPDAGGPLRHRSDPTLIRVRRGVFVDRAAFEATPDYGRHELAVRAVAAARPTAIFARESALALASLPHGRPGEVFTVGDPNVPGRRYGVRNSHVQIADEDVVVADGIARCSPAYALAQLARQGSQVDAVSALDEALRRSMVSRDEVADALGRQGPRGRRRAEWALSFADPLAASVGESWSRVLIHRLGAPPPQLQARIPTAIGDRFPDFLWERPGKRPLAGEFDGATKYGVIADANGVQAVDAVIAEKRREDAMRERVDMCRWMWEALMKPSLLRGILARAGLPVRVAMLPGW